VSWAEVRFDERNALHKHRCVGHDPWGELGSWMRKYYGLRVRLTLAGLSIANDLDASCQRMPPKNK
jgi:hypothetical protein